MMSSELLPSVYKGSRLISSLKVTRNRPNNSSEFFICSTMTILARVFFVRHGETDSNRDRIVQGQLDTQLNATGLQQAAMTAEALRHITFDKAFTSDLQRASVVRLNV
jgi:hypothetical protein